MIWRGKSIQDAWNEAEPMFARAREIEPDNLLADIAEASLLWVARLEALPYATTLVEWAHRV